MSSTNYGGLNTEKILIVDDSEMNRFMLTDMLADDFEILQAENGAEAITMLKDYGTEISLVMLDMVMPKLDGFGVLEFMRANRIIETIPVIMISVENAPKYIERAYNMGVSEFIRRPFDAFTVRKRVDNTLKLYTKQKKLLSLISDQIYEKEKSNNMMISILSHIVEFRNGESGLHVMHIRVLTELLLNHIALKYDNINLSRTDIELISTCSALHDIGKIAVPDEILNKPGRLTPEEFEIMKTHSAAGDMMLSKLPFQEEKLVKLAREICRWHHERYDGKGYPDGLKGDEIPLSAQVVSIADVYDALTSERVYKKAFSHEKAVEMILNGECGTFNPMILECLTDIADSLPEQLRLNASMNLTPEKIMDVTEETFRDNDVSISEKAISAGMAKYRFLLDTSEEALFDYSDKPSILSVSDKAAKILSSDKTIPEPKSNADFLKIMSAEDMETLRGLVKITASDTNVKYTCVIHIDGEKKNCNIVCRPLRTSGEQAELTGIIGKFDVV